MYDHLQAQAQTLSPDSTRGFVTRRHTKSHIDAASQPLRAHRPPVSDHSRRPEHRGTR